MKKYQIKTWFGCVAPPADIKMKLNTTRDSYRAQIKELEAQRSEQYQQILTELQTHPDVLPVGTKFFLWHRIKAKRQEVEITGITVRPVFETWDLAYMCKRTDGEEVTVYAGSMQEVEGEPVQ